MSDHGPGAAPLPAPALGGMLIDPHAHLQASAFDADRIAVLDAAREAGVARVLVPGWDAESSAAALALAEQQPLAEKQPWVHAGAGAHPHGASSVDSAARSAIADLARKPLVRGIGETGLDYDRGFSPRDAQLANLSWHVRLALDVGKPLILHCRSSPGQRDAQDDLLRVLAAAGVGGPRWRNRFGDRPPAVLHSFSGPIDYGERALAMGCAISFSGLVFRAGEEASGTVVRAVPTERLLVETDAPYLSPPGAPRRRNEPRWVAVTAGWVADRRGVSRKLLGDGLVRAYDALFGPA
jgi:TatD DNase family protein